MINLSIFSDIDFKYLIAGIIIAIVYTIWTYGVKLIIQKKEIRKILNEISLLYNYNVKEVSKAKYDFVLDSFDGKYKKIFIKFIVVPKNSTITVNSKDTWNMHYGGSARLGKSFPYNRYLDELKPFLNMKVNDEELKLVLIYKETLKIQKYLNESEIEIVKQLKTVYDYKIITFNEMKAQFKDL